MRAATPERAQLGFGLLALLAFGALVSCLASLEWYDTYVAAVLDQWRGCDIGDRTAWISDTTPFVAAAFVVFGVLVALSRGARIEDVVRDLAILTVGLLLAHGLKLVLLRDRPGLPPWTIPRDSFPSGHTSNIAICAGLALRLCRRRGTEGPRVQLGVAVLGTVAVLVVAFTRLYLRRHWLTDVTGSVLLATGFLFVASASLLQRRSWGPAALVLLLAGTIGTSIHAGWHVRLPSPATFADAFPARYRPRAEISGVGPAQAPDDVVFEDLGEHRLHFTIDARNEGRGVLKLLALPVTRSKTQRCRWIALRVDGELMPVRSLSARWRTYSFPMPELAPGRHEIELAVVRTPAGLASGTPKPPSFRVAARGGHGPR